MISCIGNSHSHYFAKSTNIVAPFCDKTNEYFRAYSIGASISYNFYEHHLNRVKDLIENYIKPTSDDYIMLCGFNEIDCRWHLPKKIYETNLTMDEVISECSERYFRAILELKKIHNNLIIFGSHPSTTGVHNNDPSNPVFGDCLTRNKITKCYNSMLEEKCLEHNIIYMDIFDYLINKENGLTDMTFYRDYCHLNHNSWNYMFEQFKNKGIIK